MFGESEVEVVPDYVYLGTTFSFNGLFNKAIVKQVNQARRALYCLISKARKLCLPLDIQCELFDQLVVPILLYGCEVWGFQKLDCIEMFHKKFLKSLLRVNRGTANCMVYGELGRSDLRSTVESRMVSYWARIVQGKKSKLSYIVCKLLRKLYDKGDFESRWIKHIKHILDRCGMSNIWTVDVPLNIDWVKLSLNLRLADMYKQNWNDEVNRNRLCINYRIFKSVVGFEKYLVQLDVKDRITLSRFRCGNHKLPIANGRYLPEQELQICSLCSLQDQGDEFHYVLVCPAFQNDRKQLVKGHYFKRPNVYKMYQLFNVRNIKQLKKLSRFCSIIMAKFS